MSDRWSYVMAGCSLAGALLPAAGPRLAAAGLLLLALVLRRPLLVCAGVGVLASFLSAAAGAAAAGDVEQGAFEGEIRLVSDPEYLNPGTRFLADSEHGRLEVWGWGSAGGRLSRRLAGESVLVSGRLSELPESRDWLRRDGVIGRLSVSEVSAVTGSLTHYRLANKIRATLERGAESMGRDERALFTGMVYGDDRAQSPVTADDFRAAGLTHLLAVSGQNVAFVLLLCRPFLRRLGLRVRWVVVLGVLLVFATVTRFEPSVMRATVMAAMAATAGMLGRESTGRRNLALAVTALVLWDPLLVHSLAFRLSVAASLGILFWSSRVSDSVPGPRLLASALAVTVAAQLAVSPLLIATFGGVPVAALPANLLAAPASAPVMLWGITGGFLAGLVGGSFASVLHWPTRALIWWVSSVAEAMTQLQMGDLGAVHITVLGVTLGCVVLLLRRRLLVILAWALVAVVLALPAVAERSSPPDLQTEVGWESTLWSGGGATVLVLGSSENSERLLADIRSAGVRRVDLIAARSGGVKSARAVADLKERYRSAVVWAPVDSKIPASVVPPRDSLIHVGSLEVYAAENEPRLEVVVSSRVSTQSESDAGEGQVRGLPVGRASIG